MPEKNTLVEFTAHRGPRTVVWAILAMVGLCLLPAPSFAAAPSGGTPAPKRMKSFRDCAGCPVMVKLPAGRFEMGSPAGEEGRADDEGPVRRVKIAAFAMGRTEITRKQFALFAKSTGYKSGEKCWTLEEGKVEERAGDWNTLRYLQEDDYPIGCINRNDALAYTKWLSRRAGKRYRLPTEAEWEYAARAGTRTARYWGDDPHQACAFANGADRTAQARIEGASSWSIHDCTDGFDYTAPVGSFKANAFGLHDMLGNAWEWTVDGYHDSYQGAPADGRAWTGEGRKFVLRGGSWNNAPRNMRSAGRNSYEATRRFSFFGFRVVRQP
jgi:formylglycine-generating enzyme required for sulfatase activity